MKKIWCNFLGCLLIGLFTCNVAMNILTYNLWYKTFFIDKMFMSFENNWIVVSIAVVVFLVISIGINFSSMYLFNRLSQKQIAKITDEKQKSKMKKISRIFIIINILLYVLCISKWFIDITQYDYDFLNYTEYLEDKDVDIETTLAVLTPIYTEVVNIIILVCFLAMNLLVIIPIKNTFKIEKRKKSVLANVMLYAYLSLFIIFSVFIDAYYYIDIPEFNYIYTLGPHRNEVYAIAMEYSDIRKIIREKEYVVPTKIWNKDVINISCIYTSSFPYPNLKIIIPSSTIFNHLADVDEDFRYSILDVVSTGNNEIEILDNIDKYYMDNFVLLNKDKTEAYVFCPWKSGDIYIPATVKKIYFRRIFKLNDSNIIIDDDNPYYYVYDNAIYTKPGVLQENDFVILGAKISKQMLDYSQICFPIRDWRLGMGIGSEYSFDLKLPPNLEGSLGVFGIKNVIIIPKELRSPNLYITGYITDYKIEEGNNFYVVEDGGLLVKDEMKLISLSDSMDRDGGIYIGDTVRKVDERLLKNTEGSTFNVSPDNPYIEKIENGIITYKNNVNN